MTYLNGSSRAPLGQFLWLKSFLMWAFALTVFMIVVGFPMLILVVTVGSLMAVTLQSVLPMSAVLLVTGGFGGVSSIGHCGHLCGADLSGGASPRGKLAQLAQGPFG
jgi:hypothetical protein